MNEQNIPEMLARIEKNQRKQLTIIKIVSGIMIVLVATIVVLAAVYFPKIGSMADETSQAMQSLQSVSSQLEDADLKGLVESLDEAVGSLNDVVGPITQFSNIFK